MAEEQDWIVGYEDECWWSRLAQPQLHSWQSGSSELRLQERERDKKDPNPQAVCCYGVRLEETGKLLLRFVEGQAVSTTTIGYLTWISEVLSKPGQRVLVMIWDNASWHNSKMVLEWLRKHNQQVRADHKAGKGGLRIIPCYLPVKSPWLNAIEPCWLHGKRAVVEPERKLEVTELVGRVCQHFGCDNLPFISK